MKSNTVASSSPVSSASTHDASQQPLQKTQSSGGGTSCRPKAIAGLANQLPKPDPDHASTDNASRKNTANYKISKVSEEQLKQVIEFKNRFFKKHQSTMGSESVIEGLKSFVSDDYWSILKLASHQDNNECYFDQLKAFQLPGGLHTSGHEEDLRKYREMESKDDPLYKLFKELLLFEALNNKNRLEQEFGLYFTPSSVWLTPVADKLKSLGCKAGIEVMGGKGYLSYFLETYGFKMTVSDSQESYQHLGAVSAPISVRKEDSYKTVEAFKDTADFLVISWPPNTDTHPCLDLELMSAPADYKILRLWGEKKPILFVGELPDQLYTVSRGSTGSHLFHHHLKEYFTACKFPQYQGRRVGCIDEAIIFIPNGKKLVTMGDLADQCKQM